MSYLLEWHNFIFALPLAVGLLLSVGIVFSGRSDELIQQMYSLLQQLTNKDTPADKNAGKGS